MRGWGGGATCHLKNKAWYDTLGIYRRTVGHLGHVSGCVFSRLSHPTTRPSAARRLLLRSSLAGPTRTCAPVLDEVARRPVHAGSAHDAWNVSRSPTSGMRTAMVGGGCWAPRTDPAMATAGCQMWSTSRGAGSVDGSEPHWHPGSCCICSIGTPPSPRSRPTSVRARADADRVRGKGLSTSVQGVTTDLRVSDSPLD